MRDSQASHRRPQILTFAAAFDAWSEQIGTRARLTGLISSVSVTA